MKKALFLLALTSLFTCSRDNLSEVLQNDGSGVVKLSVKLDQSFSGGTGADSPWVHQYQESAEVTFTSTTTVFTKTVIFNPNDLANFPATSLPYGDYNWSVTQTGSDVAVSSVLYVYGSSVAAFTVDAPTVTMPLVLETDFALVTVAADALSSASIRQNGVNTALTTKDGYYYGYINSNFTNYTLNVVTTDNLGGADVISNAIASTHYNYAITYQLFGATGVSVELADTFVLEDRDILTGLDEDFDGVLDTEDLCPGTRSGAPVDDNGCLDVIELDANGVTIKAKPGAANGDQQELNGITYTVVDEATLRTMVANDEDVTTVVTTLVTNLSYLFNNNATFNQDISSWDVSNVISLAYTFSDAVEFSGNLEKWNVQNVEHMGNLFNNTQFNSDISGWNVSKVTTMAAIFRECPFNQDIGIWDVSNVTNMSNMFDNSDFNQDISSWNVSKVTTMNRMFFQSPFNQEIGIWNVENVEDMEVMFNGSAFNSDISTWNVSKVTNMRQMFYGTPFNQDISQWDVKNVTNMQTMFDSSLFNQDISNWDVSNVTDMSWMFNNSPFNQDLSGWNVGNVTNCGNFNTSSNSWTLPKPNFTNCTP